MSLRERLKELSLGMNRETVSLSPYTPNWSKAFSIADDVIRKKISLGLELHHIGSTSIPNIHAKPILDILGIVPSIKAFDSNRSDLEALGFVWKGEYGIANRRYCVLYDDCEEVGLIHLHVFAKADHEVERHLVFRDYLRASPEASSRYQELKKKLVESHSGVRANYSEGKSELITQLLREAFQWKKLKIARHETGHAVMALICGQRVQKISLKEMDSPSGTDKYRAFMKLEPVDPHLKFTGERAIQKIMISLGGYASEILFYDVANIGGDDLTIAAKTGEDMLQVEEFKAWVAGLPIPASGPLGSIENPQVRAYIDYKFGDCVNALAPLKPAIQAIAAELCEREELSGDQATAILHSLLRANSQQQ